MQSKAKTVAAYLAELSPDRKAAMTQLRTVIREVAPMAAERMQYGIPAYEVGELLCVFAAQKNYFAFYLLDTEIVAKFRPQLGKLSMGKGCIRFRAIEELPMDLVRQMLVEAVQRRTAGVTTKPCQTDKTNRHRISAQ